MAGMFSGAISKALGDGLPEIVDTSRRSWRRADRVKLVAGPLTQELVFLFSDIEGSTKLWERDQDEMRVALEQHDSIVAEAVTVSGGELVKSTGDGVMAVFDDSESAVTAAISMQRRLAVAEWGSVGSVKIRVGIHKGTSQIRAGDYFGIAVNRAARIMAAGHGGQILVSAAVRADISEEMRDLGTHRLKDLAEPEHIFQVAVEGAPNAFPPLRTLDVTPNNLPTQTSSFLGREAELEAIRDLIERADTRLITLLGPGGTGKTRLSLQAGAEQVDRFPDGVFFVDLSTETVPDESFANIARVVGIDSSADETSLEALKRDLADRASLLILDNLEQIEEIGRGVDQLLAACIDLKVLATSREPLKVRSEHLYPVEPLSLPTTRVGGVNLQSVLDSKAANLLAERAAQQVNGFTIDETNFETIASICIRLDGLPLALELAAARLRMFSLDELDKRLADRIDVLSRGGHDLPGRQRTLTDTIEWSFELLTETEKELLLLLSVFAGTSIADLENIAVLSGLEGDTLEDLSSLVDKSLVRKTESPSGASRFSLLETIRAYTVSQSAADPTTRATWRRAHGEHFAELAGRLADSLAGEDRRNARRRLSEEVENLQVAWSYWRENPELDRLHQLFDPMWMLYDAEGWYEGAIQLAEDLLEVLADQPESEERTREEIALETSLARAGMLVRGYTEEGELAFLNALEHAEEAGTKPDQFPVLRSLATFHYYRGEFAKSAELGAQLLSIANESGDRRFAIDANLVCGVGAAFGSTIADGLLRIEAAVRAFDPSEMPMDRFRLGPHAGIVSMTTSAFLMMFDGHPVQAAARAEDALVKADELSHSYSKAYALFHVGYFKLITGDVEAAAHHAGELLAIANQYDYQIWRALATVLQGVVHASTGDPLRGQTVIEQGIELYQRLSTPPVFWPLILQMWAPVAAMAGDFDKAFALIDEAVAIETGRGTPMAAEMLVTKTDLLMMAGRPEEAPDYLRAALEIAVSFGALLPRLRILTRLAQLEGGSWTEQLNDAYESFTEGFDIADLVAARTALGR